MSKERHQNPAEQNRAGCGSDLSRNPHTRMPNGELAGTRCFKEPFHLLLPSSRLEARQGSGCACGFWTEGFSSPRLARGGSRDGQLGARRAAGIWFSCSISALPPGLEWQQNNARPADWLIRLHLELIKRGVAARGALPLSNQQQGRDRRKIAADTAGFGHGSNLMEIRGCPGSGIGPRMMNLGWGFVLWTGGKVGAGDISNA